MSDKFARILDTDDGGQVVVYRRWSDDDKPMPTVTVMTSIGGDVQEINLRWNSDADGEAKADKTLNEFSAEHASAVRKGLFAAYEEAAAENEGEPDQ